MFKSITKLLISFAFIMGGRFSKETLAMHHLLNDAHQTLIVSEQENIRGSKSIFKNAISEYKEKANQICQGTDSAINLEYLEHIKHLDRPFSVCPELVAQFKQQMEYDQVKFFVDYFRIVEVSRINYINNAILIISVLIMQSKIDPENSRSNFYVQSFINKFNAMAIVSNDLDLQDELILFQNNLQEILKSTDAQERNSKIEEMRTMIESMIASLE